MISVLTGVDFTIKSDELKLLEINTDIGLPSTVIDKFDFKSLMDYLDQNKIKKVNIVYKKTHVSEEFINKLTEVCKVHNKEFLQTFIDTDSIILPNISDSDDTLILRLAYNGQSILDDFYCRDKSELINLILVSPTYSCK